MAVPRGEEAGTADPSPEGVEAVTAPHNPLHNEWLWRRVMHELIRKGWKLIPPDEAYIKGSSQKPGGEK